MTTGEKLALFRKKKGMTQEKLSERLGVSRQSVSRWEMDVSFPETDKLITLSKLFECSIDYLLNDDMQEDETRDAAVSVKNCYSFIRECGYFFLATSVDDQPRLRPFGMIYEKNEMLFIVTDKRKKVFSELRKNPRIEMASYNPNTHKWIRICGKAEVESSNQLRKELMDVYSNLRRAYRDDEEMYLVIFKLRISDIRMM